MENRTENEILLASMFDGKTIFSATIEDAFGFILLFTDGTRVCITRDERSGDLIAYNPDGGSTEHPDGELEPMTPEEILDREG